MASIAEVQVPVKFVEVELSTVRLEPGDVLVVHCEERVRPEGRAMIRQLMEEHFTGHKCLVVDKGTKLGIIKVSNDVQPDVVVSEQN